MNSFPARAVQRTDPAIGAVHIDYAAADQDIDAAARGLYITVAGTLVVTLLDGSTATLSALLAGFVYPIGVRQITKAGSTAAGYVLL